jgi:hypothetical protein
LDFSRDGLGLPPKAFAQWRDVTLLRETRHAIVHRVGEITSKYLAVAEKVGLLRELGIDPAYARGSVYLDDARVANGIETCRAFIIWFDAQVRAKRPR